MMMSAVVSNYCSTVECGDVAVSKIKDFMDKHPLLGRVEVRTAMESSIRKNEDKSEAIRRLAENFGIKVGEGGSMKPPGDCPDDYESYSQDVVRYCKSSEAPLKSCKDNRSEPVYDRRIEWSSSMSAFNKCRDARETIANICFRGGDVVHKIQIKMIENSIKKCKSLLMKYSGG